MKNNKNTAVNTNNNDISFIPYISYINPYSPQPVFITDIKTGVKKEFI